MFFLFWVIHFGVFLSRLGVSYLQVLVGWYYPLVDDLIMLRDWATLIWKCSLTCRVIPNHIALIIFDSLEDMARVLKQRLWRFKRVLMTVEQWSMEAKCLIRPLMVWVKVMGIPIHAWTKDVFDLVA
ncbi:hypothetical protein AMTRI_Chr01g130430 [Amborella trichopoda]